MSQFYCNKSVQLPRVFSVTVDSFASENVNSNEEIEEQERRQVYNESVLSSLWHSESIEETMKEDRAND